MQIAIWRALRGKNASRSARINDLAFPTCKRSMALTTIQIALIGLVR